MNEKNIKYVAIAALVLVAIVFFAKRKQKIAKNRQQQNTEQAVDSKVSKSNKAGAKTEQVQGPSTEAAIQRERALHAAGFTKIPLVIDDKGAHLSFHVEIKKTCSWGDLDLIKGELAANKGAKLLLSIESVVPGDKDFKPVTKTLTFDQLAKGFDHTFTFPPSARTKSLALFLCSDMDSNSCGSKNVEDFNVAYKEFMKTQSYPFGEKPPEYKPPMRTYFFQHVLLAPDSAQVQFATKIGDDGYAKAESLLTTELGSGGSARETVKRVKDLNTKITSLPVQSSDNDLTLVLSMEDRAVACPESLPKPGEEPPMPPEGVEGVQFPGEKFFRIPPQGKK